MLRRGRQTAGRGPLARAGPPARGGKGAPAELAKICASCAGPPWLDGQSVALLFRKLRARVPQGVLFMRRNRARLARCFWGIGPLRSLSACRQKRSGTISNAGLFVRAPPVLRARARLRSAGCALARANKSLKAPARSWAPALAQSPCLWHGFGWRGAAQFAIHKQAKNGKAHGGQARPRSGAGAFQRELHSCQRPMRGKHLHVIIAYTCFTGHVASRYRIHIAHGKPWAQIPMRQFVFRAGISHWQLRSAKMPQGRGGRGGGAQR